MKFRFLILYKVWKRYGIRNGRIFKYGVEDFEEYRI